MIDFHSGMSWNVHIYLSLLLAGWCLSHLESIDSSCFTKSTRKLQFYPQTCLYVPSLGIHYYCTPAPYGTQNQQTHRILALFVGASSCFLKEYNLAVNMRKT